jgi:hypothetical protein
VVYSPKDQSRHRKAEGSKLADWGWLVWRTELLRLDTEADVRWRRACWLEAVNTYGIIPCSNIIVTVAELVASAANSHNTPDGSPADKPRAEVAAEDTT